MTDSKKLQDFVIALLKNVINSYIDETFYEVILQNLIELRKKASDQDDYIDMMLNKITYFRATEDRLLTHLDRTLRRKNSLPLHELKELIINERQQYQYNEFSGIEYQEFKSINPGKYTSNELESLIERDFVYYNFSLETIVGVLITLSSNDLQSTSLTEFYDYPRSQVIDTILEIKIILCLQLQGNFFEPN